MRVAAFLALALASLANCQSSSKGISGGIKFLANEDLDLGKKIAKKITSGSTSDTWFKAELGKFDELCTALEAWIMQVNGTNEEKNLITEEVRKCIGIWRPMIEQKYTDLGFKRSEIDVPNGGSKIGNSTGQDKEESSDKKEGTVDPQNGNHNEDAAGDSTETKGTAAQKDGEGKGKKTDESSDKSGEDGEDGCCTTTRWIVGTISTLLAAGGAGLGLWMVRQKRRSMLLP